MNTIDALISLVLALIMFGIGASLKVADFKTMFEDKKAFLTGLVFQMLFLPLFAFLITYFSDLSPAWKVGLFIIAICPGGTTSNFISYIVRADTALSIALTSINSLLILFSIPLLSNFALNFFIENQSTISVSITETFFQVLFILILPAALGVLFNEKCSTFSKTIGKPLKYINTLLLALVFGIKFFGSKASGGSGILTEDILTLLPYCLLLHIGAMVISYNYAKFTKINKLQSTTIGIEVGLQNTTLAILVTGTLIGNNEMTKPALVFAMFSFFTTLGFATFTMRKEFFNKT